MASSAAYELRSLEGRGQGLVASKDVRAEEVIFEELSLVTVKTWMILSGVVVLRREKVEQKYQALPDAARRCYRSLHPLLLGAEPAEPAAEPAELRPEEHLKVWDSCGFDFCDLEDTQWNQVLHLMICPTLLSLACGGAYAYRAHGQYVRSILAAGVLFFAILGPFCAKLFYFGSQGLFVTAARLNHSCLPNCEVRIEGKGRPAKMVLCAKKQVKKGQELTIDYIKELAHLEPSERRKLLQQDYGFLCRCPKCLALDRAVATAEEEEET
ncbi:unnamed protein product [Durusdinium trenchii]|uniref:SET domain-containing protein n=2 Tax=Durusdinium trenchii TaxID=1381693 RepID=A0ABP0S608_9DINO